MYDVIVIGGGPSGLMATLASLQAGARTLLLDKGNKLGGSSQSLAADAVTSRIENHSTSSSSRSRKRTFLI